MRDWVIFLTIHLVIPIIGIIVFLLLKRKMNTEKTPHAPTLQLFLIFGTYGIVIILLLTSLMWKWSGMASLGAIASVSIGPAIMVGTAFSTFNERNLTKYHKLTFWLSIAYIGSVLAIVLVSQIL